MTRLPAAERREQLLEVALSVFARKGFHQTSMNDVADAAGITKPVVYQHFGSKRDLYLELLEVVSNRLQSVIERATATAGGPRAQVEEGLRAYFRFVVDSADAYQLLFGGGTRRDPEFGMWTTQFERSMATTIATLIDIEGLGDRDRLLLAHGIVGLAEGTSRHWLADGDGVDPDEIAVRLADLAWRGLRDISTEL